MALGNQFFQLMNQNSLDELNKVSLFDEELINPESIIHLQLHKDRMVYVDEKVIAYEHKVVR